MSRPWRIALAVVALLVVINVALRFLGTLTGGTPGGPRSSSYATSAHGDAAYAELLGKTGHAVDQVRQLPHSSPPAAGATVFLLDPPMVRTTDLQALRRFVGNGGRLVAAGLSRAAMHELVSRPPGRAPGSRRVRMEGLQIETDGAAVWRGEGLAATRRVGSGTVELLADSSPLQNRLLGSADNAAFGLALGGPPSRPVEFLESYHGYGTGSGLSALPLAAASAATPPSGPCVARPATQSSVEPRCRRTSRTTPSGSRPSGSVSRTRTPKRCCSPPGPTPT